ncbi:MAG: hypothetical protein WB626_01300 [Bacteroidota bacterium]
MTVSRGVLWGGGSKGLARTSDGGATWELFRGEPAFPTPGIFAVAVRGDTIWTAGGFTQGDCENRVQTGAGYAVSTDNGATWERLPQTLDARQDSIETYGGNRVRFLPIIVDEQNVTFDIALGSSAVWIASWSSGLRRSTDGGSSWTRVVLPSDRKNSIRPGDSLGTYVVDPREHNNFLAFSVFLENDSVVWCGTAGGLNKSTDGGVSWTKFTTLNQQSSMAGNWVIAVAGQRLGTGTRIWATNWIADLDPEERFGVCSSDDGGRIWRTLLPGVKAYAFAFKDSIMYAATDDGIYRTPDGGASWTRSGSIVDAGTGARITRRSFFSVAVLGDTVLAGGSDGIARTRDNADHPFGSSWEVLRTARPLDAEVRTYAYPNPFAPDDEVVRLRYSTGGPTVPVTIEIFDYSMQRVRTLLREAMRSGEREQDEIWNGRDDRNVQVSNGVYFYRVLVGGGDPVWGKILVLQ